MQREDIKMINFKGFERLAAGFNVEIWKGKEDGTTWYKISGPEAEKVFALVNRLYPIIGVQFGGGVIAFRNKRKDEL